MKNDQSNPNRVTSQENKNKATAIWVLSSLLVVTVVGLIYFASKATNHKSEADVLSTNLSALSDEHQDLSSELTLLDSSYNDQIITNTELSADLSEKVLEVEKLKGRIAHAKALLSASKKENVEIKEKLVQLEELKVSLEEDIASLSSTNEELVATNQKITDDLDNSELKVLSLTDRITNMKMENTALVQRLFTIAPAGFVADNFNVYAERRNDKLTAKAKQTDEIKVQFDLKNVPAAYQTEEELFLVVTEFDGNPVKELQSKSVQIKSKEPLQVNAAAIEKTTLKDRQNIVMSFETDKNLESGMYNVLVYADHGFLGSTSFQLR